MTPLYPYFNMMNSFDFITLFRSKRDREESPNSVSNKSPSSNRIKRFAPSIKGTNEVYASLSSSRNLFEKKIRHSHSGNLHTYYIILILLLINT